ncbi:MAG: 6-phosphofructokinase, partial [Candidatus Omnitrophota bacterium]
MPRPSHNHWYGLEKDEFNRYVSSGKIMLFDTTSISSIRLIKQEFPYAKQILVLPVSLEKIVHLTDEEIQGILRKRIMHRSEIRESEIILRLQEGIQLIRSFHLEKFDSIVINNDITDSCDFYKNYSLFRDTVLSQVSSPLSVNSENYFLERKTPFTPDDPLIQGVKFIEPMSIPGLTTDAKDNQLLAIKIKELMHIHAIIACHVYKWLNNINNKFTKNLADGEAAYWYGVYYDLLEWLRARVVIGEGERDEAPMLYIGQHVGGGYSTELKQREDPDISIGLDVVELTNGVVKHIIQATCSPGIYSEIGGLFSAPDLAYLATWVIGQAKKGKEDYHVDIRKSAEENINIISIRLEKPISELRAGILLRPRHSRRIVRMVEAGIFIDPLDVELQQFIKEYKRVEDLCKVNLPNTEDLKKLNKAFQALDKKVKAVGIYRSGNLYLLADGSVMPTLAIKTDVMDFFTGGVGPTEGVMAAALSLAIGGESSSRLVAYGVLKEENPLADLEADADKFNPEEIARLAEFGIVNPDTLDEEMFPGQIKWDHVFDTKELAPGKEVVFIASAIKDMPWVEGMHGVRLNEETGEMTVCVIATTAAGQISMYKITYETAISVINKQIEKSGPDNNHNNLASLYYQLGKAYGTLRLFAKAEAAFEQSQQLRNASSDKCQAAIEHFRGMQLLLTGQFNNQKVEDPNVEAVAHFEQALELSKHSRDPSLRTREILLALYEFLGDLALKAREYRIAESYYTLRIRRDPTNPSILVKLRKVESEEGAEQASSPVSVKQNIVSDKNITSNLTIKRIISNPVFVSPRSNQITDIIKNALGIRAGPGVISSSPLEINPPIPQQELTARSNLIFYHGTVSGIIQKSLDDPNGMIFDKGITICTNRYFAIMHAKDAIHPAAEEGSSGYERLEVANYLGKGNAGHGFQMLIESLPLVITFDSLKLSEAGFEGRLRHSVSVGQVISYFVGDIRASLNMLTAQTKKDIADYFEVKEISEWMDEGWKKVLYKTASSPVSNKVKESDLPEGIPASLKAFFLEYNINPKKTILFAMSGGDCAGPNSAYYGAVRRAAAKGYTVLGVVNGFEGLGAAPEEFSKQLVLCSSKGVVYFKDKPSIYLGSSRAKFKDKKDNILQNCRPFFGVIFIGGDDHSKQAGEIAKNGIPTTAIPKTIDYDFFAESLGSHSAASEARMLTLRSHEAAREEKFVQIIEFMGRDAGWITYLAGQGFFILIPERSSYFKEVLIKVLNILLVDGYLTIAMAEGYNFKDFSPEHRANKDTLFYDFIKIIPFLNAKFHSKGQTDPHGNPKLSGISEYLSLAIRYLPQLSEYDNDLKLIYEQLKRKYPSYFGRDVRYGMQGEVMRNVRLSIPGYVFRGLPPDDYDMLLGILYGNMAVDLLLEGKSGLIVTASKAKRIRSYKWLFDNKKKAVCGQPIDEIAKKHFVIKSDEPGKENIDFAFSDVEAIENGVWWQGCENVAAYKKVRKYQKLARINLDTRKQSRRMFLSSLISSITHGTSSVFGFRGVEGVSSDELTLYSADQAPDNELLPWQQYCLENGRGNTLILLSSHSAYLKDLLMEIIRRMNQVIKIEDEKRMIKRQARGFINLAVSDKYMLLDFEKVSKNNRSTGTFATGLIFYKLLEIDHVLKSRYEFNQYFFDRGEPGFMELMHTLTSAITYLPQLAEFDDDLKAGIEKLRVTKPGIFGKDPEKEGCQIIKGVRMNMPNQVLGKLIARYSENVLRKKGVWGKSLLSQGSSVSSPVHWDHSDETSSSSVVNFIIKTKTFVKYLLTAHVEELPALTNVFLSYTGLPKKLLEDLDKALSDLRNLNYQLEHPEIYRSKATLLIEEKLKKPAVTSSPVPGSKNEEVFKESLRNYLIDEEISVINERIIPSINEKYAGLNFASGVTTLDHVFSLGITLAGWRADINTLSIALLHELEPNSAKQVLKDAKAFDNNAIKEIVWVITKHQDNHLPYLGRGISLLGTNTTALNYMNFIVQLYE